MSRFFANQSRTHSHQIKTKIQLLACCHAQLNLSCMASSNPFSIVRILTRTKFHRLLFIFNSFIIFGIFFSISPIQTCQKIIEIFVVLQSKEQTFFQQILKISKSSFTKIEICEIFFFKNPQFSICFSKIMERFSKKYRHLKFKIIHKFHYLLFVFYYFISIFDVLFPISPN